MAVIFAVYFLMGVLFAALSMPLIGRKVKPNPWYGFRTRRTLSDERIWYDANEYAGRMLLLAGIGISLSTCVLALLFGLLHGSVAVYSLACAAAMVLLVFGAIALSLVHLSKL